MKTRLPSIRSLALALALGSAPTAFAQTNLDWDNGGADTNWSTADNWSTNVVPTDTAPYNSIRVGGGFTSNLDTSYFANSISLLNASGHTVNAGGGTLTIDNANKASTTLGVITNSQASTLTINAPVVFAATGLTGNTQYRINGGNAASVITISSLTVNAPTIASGTPTFTTAVTSAGTLNIGTLSSNYQFNVLNTQTNLGASSSFTGVLTVGSASANSILNLTGNIGNNATSGSLEGTSSSIYLSSGVNLQRNFFVRTASTTSNIGSLAGVTGTAQFSGTYRFANDNKILALSPEEADMTITYSGDFEANSTNANNGRSILKTGAGVAVVSGQVGGATTQLGIFHGGVKIEEGTLRLGADERIQNTTNLTLNGGTFDLAGFDETLNTLKLDATSTINFALNSDLIFADSSALVWSGTLNITGWDGTGQRLRFGTDANGLTTTQLSMFSFGGNAAEIDSAGWVTAVPEPSTWALLAGSLTLVMVLRRRRQS